MLEKINTTIALSARFELAKFAQLQSYTLKQTFNPKAFRIEQLFRGLKTMSFHLPRKPNLRRRQTYAGCGHQTGQGILAGLETEKHMSKLKHAASVPHADTRIAELRTDPAFPVEYLKSAMEELDNPEHRAVGLLALRDVAEAYGGLATVAQEAGITREALYPALSPRGNPTLKTLLAVLHVVGMRLSVAPAGSIPAHR